MTQPGPSKNRVRSLSKGQKTQRACHHLVAKTAQDIAGAWYEDAAKNNSYHQLFTTLFPGPDPPRAFIAACWGEFVPAARTILAKMLGNSACPETMKAEIAEALILDRGLPRRDNVFQTAVTTNMVH